jgi:hypothetical protein
MNAREADIVIGGISLTEGQSMTVRVAVNHFLLTLRNPEFVEGIGDDLALNYRERLLEIGNLISRVAR